MYEDNRIPLPGGDAAIVFAEQLSKMERALVPRAAKVTPGSVVRWADRRNQPHFATICRRLLLPGSGAKGLSSLGDLARLAAAGKSCLICLNHRSNLDVPTLYALLEDHGQLACFHRVLWVSGRKLEEDEGLTGLLVQCFNRVVVTPRSWFTAAHTEEEVHDARVVNIAARRAIDRLRFEGWVFALFPTGTRVRPNDESTKRAVEETHNYLRLFEHLLLCHIDGCTMPVSKDHDLTRETPRLDRVLFRFGPVLRTEAWLAKAAAAHPDLDPRVASARAITEDIEELAPAEGDGDARES